MPTMDAIVLHGTGRDGGDAHAPEVGIEVEPDSVLVAPNIGGAALAFGDDLILALEDRRRFLERLFDLHLAPAELPMKL